MWRISRLLARLWNPRAEGASKLRHPDTELSEKRRLQLRELEGRIGHHFRDPNLLDRALTHKSYLYSGPGSSSASRLRDYEALEFLGDSILGFIISEYLVRTFPDRSEGELSKLKSFLVSTGQLFDLSRSLELGDFLHLSYGEEKSGGRKKKAILADLFESLTAAIYLDGGLEPTRAFVLGQFQGWFEKIARRALEFRDYKSTLQETLHLKGLPEPSYRVVTEVGPDHRKQFVVAVEVQDFCLGQASGMSKKEAEQQAARLAMEKLGELDLAD